MGVLALLGAARFGCGEQADSRRAAPERLLANERGVRLAMLRPQEEAEVGYGAGAGAVETVTGYALMT